MTPGLTIAAIVLLLFDYTNQYTDTCPMLYRRYSTRHTFCLPPNPSCNILEHSVSAADQQYIVQLHNEYRSKIATGNEIRGGTLPPAADMLQMVWNDELAAVAQKHAEQCHFAHDCRECRKTKNFDVGQNIYESWTTATGQHFRPDWTTAIQSWYNEVDYFHPGIIHAFGSGRGSGVIGHFTQMIWAKTWQIGCGYVLHHSNGRFYQLYTCNYGPGGNVLSSEIYQPGKTCSRCPANTCCGSTCNTHPAYHGLCQVKGNSRPAYAPPPGHYSYFCDFGQWSTCNIDVPQYMKPWKVSHTLSDSYVGVVLSAGETSVLNFTSPFERLPQMCVSLAYRKGPNVAGQPAHNVAKEHFHMMNTHYDTEMPLARNAPSFATFGMTLNYNMDIMFSISFSVPHGAPDQYFEAKDVSVRAEQC